MRPLHLKETDTVTETQHIARQDARIAEAYQKWYGALFGYICKRIGWDRTEDAEDLVQETFLHLLLCTTPLEGERLMRFVYKVASNQVIDYLRHHAHIEAARMYFMEHAQPATSCTEEQVAVNELERLEQESLSKMSRKKAQVYVLYVHQGKSVSEISSLMTLSRRTVENHIFRARCDIREYLKVC